MNILGKKHKTFDYSFLLYFSYKTNFDLINNIDNDIGWGCTIRSCQMLLSNILLKNKLKDKFGIIDEEYYDYIIYIFKDNYNSLFGLHQFVKYYEKYDKKIGDYVGPYTITSILENFNNILNSKFNIIYINNIYDKHSINNILDNDINNDKSYLINFTVKLGINNIDDFYNEYIIDLIKNKYFMGIISGKELQSYYIIGITDDNKLLYLDPHNVMVYSENILDKKDYYANNMYNLDIKYLSPTISFSFLINNKDEVLIFYENLKKNKILNIVDKLFDYNLKIDNEWTIVE